MKIKLSFITFTVAAVAGLLCVDCSSGNKLTKAPKVTVIVTSTPSSASAPAENDSSQINVIIDDADVDSLINGAEFACNHQDFEAAHLFLREAIADLKIIQANDSGWAETEDYYEKYFKDIARIYSELMPAKFSDSIPEEISIATLRGQLSQSLDSIKIPPSDSVLMQNILNQKKTTYNFPIVLNDRVYKALYFLGHGRKGPLDRWISQAYYYLPAITKIFADSGLPTDLSYLPLIESGFNPLAYSRAHAAGMWQFIASTGTRYGMRKDGWVDERRDFIKSTKGAVCYLKKLYNQFGDWHIALASYNCGENGMANALGRASAKNFWQLKVPRETKNYIPEFIAALIIAKNPQCFGFSQDPSNVFNLDTVEINDCISLYTIADSLKMPAEDLKRLNPHILHWCTHPTMQQVTLYLPKGSKEKFVAAYTNSPEDFRVSWSTYQIRSGDNLKSVARHFGVPFDALLSLNNVPKSTRLAVGQEISIPISNNPGDPHGPIIRQEPPRAKHYTEMNVSGMRIIKYKVRAGDCVWGLAQIFRVNKNDVCKWNHISETKRLKAGMTVTIYKPAGPQPFVNASAHNNQLSMNNTPTKKITQEPTAQGKHIVYYRVQKGDNLWNIAQTFKVPVKEITMMNNLQSDSSLTPGEVLKVPMAEEM